MTKILSQEEIDALLRGMDDGEVPTKPEEKVESGIVSYDLTNQDRIIRGRMPTLEMTNEKFVQTPRGVLPLKFFFSSGLSTTDGEDVSARGIKDQIQKLVQGEDPKNPLSDQKIAEMLSDSSIQIARRTVTKYREALRILSSTRRKEIG